MPITLKHQSLNQFLSRLREDYRSSERARTVHLAEVITSRIADGDLTANQVRAAFGLSTAQWNALRTKMDNLASARRTLRGAVGE